MTLKISEKIQRKLAGKHGVCEGDVKECFRNRDGGNLKDTREEHKTDPPTLWFISETDKGRKLKIVFMFYKKSGNVQLKSAFEPNSVELEIYSKKFPPTHE